MRRDGETIAAQRALESDPSYFRVLIGNTDTDIDETIAHVIGDAIEGEVEGLDLEFVACPSMRDVESLARRQPVDLFVLVLDNLLDCSVGTALRRVQGLKATHGRPVLALSGFNPSAHSRASIREAALAAGADAFFWLPLSAAEIKDRVPALVPRGRAPQPEARGAMLGRVEYPTEGFSLQWDASALHIRVTDHHARPLRIPWEDLVALAKIATGER